MLTATFEYHRPSTLREALALLGSLDRAEIISGGTDLLVDLKREARKPKHLVSIADIDELHILDDTSEDLLLGALNTHKKIAASPTVGSLFPDIEEAARSIGSEQVRNAGTIGGNLCTAASCSDMAPPLLARKARLKLESSTNVREILLADFFSGPRKTVLARDEIMTMVIIPKPIQVRSVVSKAGDSESPGSENTGASRGGGASPDSSDSGRGRGAAGEPVDSGAFVKFGLREGSVIAVASVAVVLRLEAEKVREARIALGAVAPTPILAKEAGTHLKDSSVEESAIEEAARIASRESQPISDARGSEEFRRHLVQVLTKKAIRKAIERAKALPEEKRNRYL